MELIETLKVLFEYDEPMEEAEIEFVAIILKRIEDGKEITNNENRKIQEIYSKYIG